MAEPTGLNPYAEEFIPASRSQPTYYQQNIHIPEDEFRYDFGTEFQQSIYPHSSVQNRLVVKRPPLNTPDEFREFMTDDQYNPVCKINEVIDLLNNKPARYDFIIGPLADSMAEPLKCKEFSEIAVKLITSQAVGKPNFRYNAARICIMFDQLADCFRSILLNECLEDIQRYADNAAKDKNRFEQEIPSVCGCVLFVAEIYTQIVATDNYDQSSMKDLANAIIQLLGLLMRPDKECIKSICQALKLCGSQLSRRNPEGLSNLICTLSDVQKGLDDISIERLVGSVVNLSGCSWGQSDFQFNIDSLADGAYGMKGDTGTNSFVYDEITYYGPDGQVISEEEANFLLANLELSADSDDYDAEDENGDDGDSLWDPNNEIEPEIQAAFKEFVQYSAQNNG